MNAKSARADCNRRRQPDAADNRQARILLQHPGAELEVDARVVYPAEGARVALMFLGLLDAAKGALRGKARLLRAHALREEAIFKELEVRADLAREIVFGLGERKGAARRRRKRLMWSAAEIGTRSTRTSSEDY